MRSEAVNESEILCDVQHGIFQFSCNITSPWHF